MMACRMIYLSITLKRFHQTFTAFHGFNIHQCAQQVVLEADLDKKCIKLDSLAKMWQNAQTKSHNYLNNGNECSFEADYLKANNDNPGRPLQRPPLVKVVQSHKQLGVPLEVCMLHALAHIELNAMDLYTDTIARFCGKNIPKAFYDDMIAIALDEKRHFLSIRQRLQEKGFEYGALPAHAHLWKVGIDTKNSVLERLACVPLAQECRGLDSGERLVERLSSVNDKLSAKIVDTIVKEEVRHVSIGLRWFEWLCSIEQPTKSPMHIFHSIIRERMGGLVPPFNVKARAAAGMDASYYEPIAANPESLTVRSRLRATQQNHLKQPPAGVRGIHSGKNCHGFLMHSSTLFQFHHHSKRYSSSYRLENGAAVVFSAVFPEPTSSAAGVRTLSLLEILKNDGYRVYIFSPAKETAHCRSLVEKGFICERFAINDPSLVNRLAALNVTLAIFDQFTLEEQVGLYVQQACPKSLRVLDTQDLHFLRKARERMISNMDSLPATRILFEPGTSADDSVLLRELAAIYRSHLTLVVSTFEMELLKSCFGIPDNRLCLSPFYYKKKNESTIYPRHRRHGFITIGNWQHAPNVDSIMWLRERIWPLIKCELPDAEMHVTGAYPRKEHMNLTDTSIGFIVKPPALDVHSTLLKYVALLAPLRFGAGIKGKLFDAWTTGTPTVTTTIGCEGWSKTPTDVPSLFADDPQLFAAAAVRLYNDDNLWAHFSVAGLHFCQERLDFDLHAEQLIRTITHNRQLVQENGWHIGWTNMIVNYASRRSNYLLAKYVQQQQELRQCRSELDSLRSKLDQMLSVS